MIWDGLVHAWMQDVMVSTESRSAGVGLGLVHTARDSTSSAGCEWLHVDFDDDLRGFYLEVCGFEPTNGGLMAL